MAQPQEQVDVGGSILLQFYGRYDMGKVMPTSNVTPHLLFAGATGQLLDHAAGSTSLHDCALRFSLRQQLWCWWRHWWQRARPPRQSRRWLSRARGRVMDQALQPAFTWRRLPDCVDWLLISRRQALISL